MRLPIHRRVQTHGTSHDKLPYPSSSVGNPREHLAPAEDIRQLDSVARAAVCRRALDHALRIQCDAVEVFARVGRRD